MDKPQNEILQTALRCAERWSIFPCHNESKRPLTARGLKDATRDGATITAWFIHWPGAMCGIRCGAESGIFVVDCDVTKDVDGVKALKELCPDLPETIAVKTPRNGRHYYFSYPNDGTVIRNSASKIADAIDVRGEGGYVIAAGSRRSDGAYYEALADVWPNPPPAPQALIDLLTADKKVAATNPELEAFAKAAARHRKNNGAGYSAAALNDECDRVANAPVGRRNHQVNASAFSLGQLVAAGVLDESEVRSRLKDAAATLAKDDGMDSVEKTITSGLTAGMKQPRQVPERQRFHEIAQTARVRAKEDSEPPPPLQFLDLASWQNVTAPPRAWVVLDRVPLNNVTLLSGEGAVGKTIVGLQLCVATVLARDWIGTMPEPGPVLAMCCEDDADELHRRLDAIVRHYGASFTDLVDLHVMSLAGRDALLATPRKDGLLQPTGLFKQLSEAARDLKPKLILIDNSADVFGGNENDRAQVRQFIGLLRGLAMAGNSGLLLTSHPSLTGITSGTGLSGSTAWNASVRSRLYLKRATTPTDEEPDPNLRVLEVMKNNYGPVGETITLRWKDGLFLPVAAPGSLEKLAREQKVDELFLTLLDRWNGQGRNLSHKNTANAYAPSRLVGEPDAKTAKVSKRELADAMERLFRSRKIHVVSYGLPSKGWTRIERK